MNKLATHLFPLAAVLASAASLQGQTRNYAWDFESDSVGAIFDNSPTFNYTNNNNSTTLSAGGTLVFRGNSSNSDYVIASISSSNFLRIQSALNTQTDDFGIYIGGLDFSDYASGANKTVSFSFDILGNSVTSTNDWEVNYTLGSSTAGHTGFVNHLSDKSVFSFANSGSSATTVTGSFSLLDGEGSTLGGLFISGPRDSSGNATLTGSGGSLALDNISVTVVPEPSDFALLAGGLALGIIASRRRLSNRK